MSLPRLRSACSLVALATLVLQLFAAAAPPAQGADKAAGLPAFRLVDGDRVVLLGSTFIERAQSHGYLEAALAGRFAGANVKFRNLGWSGDNVFGESRAGFGPVEHGFAELKEHVLALEPTVILLSYGANESFAGQGGLDGFLAGLDVLLATLDETGARIVFVGPPPQEDLGRPLPDPGQHNKDLKLYSAAIAKVAERRGAPFVNLSELLGGQRPSSGEQLTSDGLQLTAYGYWRVTPVIERALGLPERSWEVEVDARRANIAARGTHVDRAKFSPGQISFHARDALLPLAPPPEDAPAEDLAVSPRTLRVYDLPPGDYALSIDGQQVATGNQRAWVDGVMLHAGPEFEQAERLRQTILEKNELYFHRWRPENVTYLFGFRKHEQGNNAVEIPQFDPLVAAREATIRTLSVPVEHEYQLIKVEE